MGASHTVLKKIKGLLIPTEWDEQGSPLSLCLLTENETEYKINKNDLFPSLLDISSQFVEISGFIDMTSKPFEIFTKSFRPLPHLLNS